MAAQIEPDAMRRIQKAVWELADMEYPASGSACRA
jgi:hypothetical protein